MLVELTDRGNPPRIGDRVTFKAATRSHNRKATRVITGVDEYDRLLVTYHGWSGFVVLAREVIRVQEQDAAPAPATTS